MKKFIGIIIIIFFSFNFFAQSTQLDFSMQLQNTNQHEALIYPNPTHDLAFKVKSTSIITNIEILNMLGKSIYQKNIRNYTFDEITVRMPECDKGVYLIKIIFDDNKAIIKKLLYQ